MSKALKIHARIVKAYKDKPIEKTVSSEILDNESTLTWKEPTLPLKELREIVRNSNILPQCITAYKDNICGFGIGIRYIDDVKETQEMIAEYQKAEEIIDLLNLDTDTKEVFEDLIQGREETGIGYLEIIRNLANEVSQIEYIREAETVRMTARLEPTVKVIYFYKGVSISRDKKFRKFKQEKNGKTVYFKEFGDPRIMDKTSGRYLEEGENLAITEQANEILDFPIGTDDYGCIRWIGQILTVDGTRRAEHLNNNYFVNGRHTPLAVIVSGGTLSEDSWTKLQEYMNGIQGENGQHSFLVLEVEDAENKTGIDADNQPKVELKDMAAILQKDELFQDYIENGRKKAQSAFRLPDLYTGYTSDFNRATAQAAQEITEKQVFQPERASLAWTINHKLLNEYGFKHVEAYFKEPDITNPDDLYKLFNVANQAGGVTPNDAREVALSAAGRTSELFVGEWANIPLNIQNLLNVKESNALAKKSLEMQKTESKQLEEAIQKAEMHNEVEVVAVMKEVRNLLKSMKAGE